MHVSSFESATNPPLTITGGPGKIESLQAWRTRLQSELVEQERAKQDRAEQRRAEEQERLELVVPNSDLTGRTSSSLGGGGESEHSFRVHLESFSELRDITRENRETLEQMKHLVGKPSASSFPPGTELTETAKMRELDSLVAMAKTLGEVTVSATWNTSLGGSEDGKGSPNCELCSAPDVFVCRGVS